MGDPNYAETVKRARGLLDKEKSAGSRKKTRLEEVTELGERNLRESKARDFAAVDDDEEARLFAPKLAMQSLQNDKRHTDELERQRQKYVEMADPLQKYRKELDEISRLQELGILSTDQALAASWEVNERMTAAWDKQGEAIKNVDGMAKDLGFTFASAAEDAILKWESVGDVLRGLGQDVARIFLRSTITEPLGNSLAGAFKGMGGGSGLLSGIKNMFTFDGGGYTGAGSRSGGLDGKGGFMAVLHPNETVVDHNKGGISGGVTIIQNINIDSRSDQGTIAAAMVQAKNAAVAEVHNAMRRGAWA
jgi:hypothetical protein